MTYLLAVGVGPALLVALAAGLGLGVDRLAGSRLRGALILPVGFAALIVAGQFAIRIWAPASPYIAVVLAVAGVVAGRARARSLLTRAAAIPAVATAVVYVLAASPVLFSGRATMPTYLLDSSTGNHISGAHALLEHGPSMASESLTADGLYLRAYFGSGYPSGGHVSFGILDTLVPGSGLWLWAPFLACLLALITPSVWATLRALDVPRTVAAVGAVAASVPMITLAYAWMGAIKEIAAAPVLVAMGALIATTPASEEDDDGGVRAMLPLALTAGALLACVGVAGAAWVTAAGAAFVVLRFATVRARPALVARGRPLLAFVAGTIVFCIPTLLDFSKAFNAAKSFSQSNAVAVADPGNLVQPLHAVQALGTWIVGDHRVDPVAHAQATYQFIGVALLLVGLAVLHLVRMRRWGFLVWLTGVTVIWWALTRRGTDWTDAKLIVLTAPLAVTLTFIGVAGATARASNVARGLVVLAAAAGIFWSLGVEYRSTNLLPTARYQELIDMGDRIERDKGTVYLTEFDEYVFGALPDLQVAAAGFAYTPVWASFLRDGKPPGYGASVDIDQVTTETLEQSPWIVQRRGPLASRPPSNYEAVDRGRFYTLWKRTGEPPLEHISAFGPRTAPSASGELSCSVIHRLADRARDAGGRLMVATAPATRPIDLASKAMSTSPAWLRQPDGGFALDGAGRMQTRIDVPSAGRWDIWLVGDLGRDVTITVDGRVVGAVGRQSGSKGNAIGPVTTTLGAGRHKLSVFRAGHSLRPGDAMASTVRAGYIQSTRPATLRAVDPADWHDLCGRQLDWIEAVAR